jgi:DNA primase catalytic core
MQVGPDDRRPTGPPQMQKATATWQRRLNRRLAGDSLPAIKEWGAFLRALAPQIRGDDFTPLLAQRLTAMSRAGVQARDLATSAAAAAPLPDDHAAAALWWRMARHLTPAVAEQLDQDSITTTGWTPRLVDLFGAERAQRLQASSWWPALVANIDHGLQRGWRLEDLLSTDVTATGDDIDECQALVWRTSIALDPIPDEHDYDYGYDEPTPDMLAGVEPHGDAIVDDPPEDLVGLGEEQHIAGDLAVAALVRDNPVPLEPSDADIRRLYERADQWEHSPVSRERMLEVNTLTQAFFEDHLAGSWGHTHLTERFGVDLTGHEHFRPGHAPDGWANLVNHLRRRGVTDEEMLATGVASRAKSGRLIDRFRGRVMFPVTAPGSHGTEILGFVGRRHPKLADADYRAPKYLNTADTPLFHKGAQLFGFVDELVAAGAIPVLVEGPMDAIAVTLATGGRYVGLAPLGTSLTDEQAAQLAGLGHDPVVATDADLAGRVAAERDFWLLAQYGLDPTYAQLPAGADPADLLTQHGPTGLTAALLDPQPLGDHLLAERLANLPPDQARAAAIKILAARPSRAWEPGLDQIATHLQLPLLEARRNLRDAIKAWDADPRKAAKAEAGDLRAVRDRLEASSTQSPDERWASLAAELDPRLVEQPDWPATADVLQQAHDQGHDVAASARGLVSEDPLGEHPARELRYRIVARLDLGITAGDTWTPEPAVRRERPPSPAQPRPRRPAPRP